MNHETTDRPTRVPNRATIADLTLEVDARICSLHRVADVLRARVEETRQDEGAIDVRRIEGRAGYIAAMRYLHDSLQKLLALVARNGADADSLHKAEVQAAQEGLSRAQIRMAASTVKAAGQKTAPGARMSSARTSPVPPRRLWADPAGPPAKLLIPAPLSLARRPVRIAGDFMLEATVVPAALETTHEILAAVAPGGPHFIPQWNQFAFRIGPCVFHANLGRIYHGAPLKSAGPIARETPVRVKGCHRRVCAGAGAGADTGGCRYYHDPADHPGSMDTRNFVAEAWLYAPASAPARAGARRVGSAAHLEADLRVLGVEEARRFLDQTAHDIVCALLIWSYVLAPMDPMRGGPGPRGQKRRA